ncbi:hypothetical protein TSAR_010905 [Trichomalopsis sarcophagae]|uniref:Uncharacterized protein n=1 Tax=Trichomalopsis sarcophagae TaxID=543379 RepID=A0A232F595_9HYME|nr:hypothetical protein TSAR_010905 [Trichomalopsis sarcophagae]
MIFTVYFFPIRARFGHSNRVAFNGQTTLIPAFTIVCNLQRHKASTNIAKLQNDAMTIVSVVSSSTFTAVHIRLCCLHVIIHLQSIEQKSSLVQTSSFVCNIKHF